tara:strand:+ start:848 stop:1108 length:261 start_codon:yes stop_codon:yes gene_type:complete
MCNYYDEDDYEVASPSTIDEGEFFGDIEEEQDFDLMVESMDSMFDACLMQVQGDLVIALAEGDFDRADRLQDEVDLLLMTDFEKEI